MPTGEEGMSDQEIVRGSGDGQEVLYLADECNHVRWMSVADIGCGLDSVHCEECDTYGIRKTWRRVYVKA